MKSWARLWLVLAAGLAACAGGNSDDSADGGGDGDAGGNAADAAPGTPDGLGGPAGAPRPTAPLSTAMVTSARPVLHWQLGSASLGASVELCRDAAMSDSCQTFTAYGTSIPTPTSLAPGGWFWRLHGFNSDGVGPDAGPVWQFRVGVQPPGPRISTSYGSSVDLDNNGYPDIVVGAPDTTLEGLMGGRLYIYMGSASGFPDEPTFTLLPPETVVTSDHWPSTIADAGDVNGDGYTELIVGRMSYNAVGMAGTVHIYYGSADGPTAPVPMPSDFTGWGVGIDGVGDVNGDGYGDVLIGAEPKGAWVYHGSADGLIATPATTLIIYDQNWGSILSRAGDVNGDGYGDFLIRSSSTSNNPNFPSSMITQLYVGGPTGAAIYPDFTISAHPSDIACGGDINGDGYSDMIFGEDDAYGGKMRIAYGRSYINSIALESLVHEDTSHWWDFGAHVAGAGDVNADGYDDILVTGNYSSQDYSRLSSGVQVYPGHPMANYIGILMVTLDAQDTDPGTAADIASVASAGDFDNDGKADVILGMYVYPGLSRLKLHSSANWTPAAATITAPDEGYPSFSRELVASGP